MSELEKSTARVTSFDESMEELDEGHEEWLSEGILTDDDDNVSRAVQNESVNDVVNAKVKSRTSSGTDNIEATLVKMEKYDDNVEEDELPGDLGTFLIRKADGQIIHTGDFSETDSLKQSDDGHDTDELLRVLGDDDQKVKKTKEVLKDNRRKKEALQKKKEENSTDEEGIFDSPKVTRLMAAKKALMKRVPKKAVQEDLSDEERMTSDDGATVKKMFNIKRKGNFAAKSTAKSSLSSISKKVTRTVTLKPQPKPSVAASTHKRTKAKVKTPEQEEVINEEFLDEDAFDMDEFDRLKYGDRPQPLMSPERMDEELPSDEDSGSEEGSLYDELPSSESDDLEEWFTLDIRAERAGDYLPLLGNKAHKVLLEEKNRISGKVLNLRQSLTVLLEGSRGQAEQLRRASVTVAELDAAIKAAS